MQDHLAFAEAAMIEGLIAASAAVYTAATPAQAFAVSSRLAKLEQQLSQVVTLAGKRELALQAEADRASQ